MEKFRLFTDKATGINPFTPIRGLDKISWPRFFLGLLVLIGTIPLIVLIETIICVYESLYTVFAILGVQIVIETLLGPFQWIMTRLYLILIHHTFWSGSTSAFPKNPRKQLLTQANPKNTASNDEPNHVKPGDVIVVNCQSPVDVVILQRVFWSTPLLYAFPSSTSTAESNEDSDKNKNASSTPGVWWTAFRHGAMLRILSSSAIPSARPENVDVRALQRLGKKIGRPVVLFAEGTPTNGKSVLQFPQTVTVEGELGFGALSLAGITYNNAAAVNATIPQAALSFFIRVFGESVFSSGNQIDVVLSRPSALVQLQLQDPESVEIKRSGNSNINSEVTKLTTSSVISEIKGDVLQQALSDCVSFERLSAQPCRCVSLSCEDKTKFYDMWVKHGALV